MEKLGERTAFMISNATKMVGLSEDIYFYIEEQLYIHEAEEIHKFINWLVKHKIPFVENNLESRFQSYKKGVVPYCECEHPDKNDNIREICFNCGNKIKEQS